MSGRLRECLVEVGDDVVNVLDAGAQADNDYILPAYQGAIDGFVAAGGDAEIPRAILGVKKEYLDAAFDQMETGYGSIDQYF